MNEILKVNVNLVKFNNKTNRKSPRKSFCTWPHLCQGRFWQHPIFTVIYLFSDALFLSPHTDTENIRFVFAAVKDTILQQNLKEYNLVQFFFQRDTTHCADCFFFFFSSCQCVIHRLFFLSMDSRLRRWAVNWQRQFVYLLPNGPHSKWMLNLTRSIGGGGGKKGVLSCDGRSPW